MSYIDIDESNIDSEHICCAIADKKCKESYGLKKDWMKKEFKNGFVFKRLDERAKVFIEYSPSESAWLPIEAPNYITIGCFWVSGKYKGTGHGKALLQDLIDEAKAQGKSGIVAVVGAKKFHFMSDQKWLKRQGFVECDSNPAGFSLLVLSFEAVAVAPQFYPSAKKGISPYKDGYVAYYTNRCPYTEYHIKESLKETADKRGLNIKVIKLNSVEEAQASPTPATIFSLFYNGEFVTTDLSVCMDSRFDKIISKYKK